MKFKSSKRITSWLLCMMLIVAMAFATVGCEKKDNNDNNPSATESETTVLGEGKTTFTFVVVDKDGSAANFEIHTDKDIVGEALLDLELIAGDAGDFGLYVKTVNGITAEYDTDQTYWAFYINDEYAATGVDKTTIEEGATYSFRVEK